MKQVDVAAAILQRSDGSFLLGQRAADTFYPGYWEFPGGKIEEGESAREALVRELREELGIEVLRADPWLRRQHVYEHAHVRLNFFRVSAWRGELHDHVHQALHWQQPEGEGTTVAPMLPANAPVLAALSLPDFYAITHAHEIGVQDQLAALEAALAKGLKLLLVREPGMGSAALDDFASRAVTLCHAQGARVLLHADVALARRCGADGVHLPTRQLMTLSQRPELPLVAASCHDPAELEHAASLGCDFAVFGPVMPTASHPGSTGLGWAGLARQLDVPPLPVYALGGLAASDLDSALKAGAHGVAAIRAAWQGR